MATHLTPYETDMVALETGVEAQLGGSAYDFRANKSLLKQYQFRPDLAKVDCVAKVLILALMHLPSADFLALSYLVGKLEVEPKIQLIKKLDETLEGAKFQEFWSVLASPEAKEVASVRGFTSSVRQFILLKLQNSHRSVSKADFQASLGMSDVEFDSFIASSKEVQSVLQTMMLCFSTLILTQVDGTVVYFTPCEGNQNKVRQFEETLRFEEVGFK